MGTLYEDQYTLMIISRSVLLRMRNVLDKHCRENQSKPLMFSKFFFEYHAVYEIITIWRISIACWIPKTTDTHLEYIILIAFPLQQLLYERASMVRYAYIACLVFN